MVSSYKKNKWDLLSERFNTTIHPREVHPDAAVNICIGWPIFLQQIETQKAYLGVEGLEILDFGCGTGSMCKQLHELGHKITGVDRSRDMLKKARMYVPKEVNLIEADHKSIGQMEELVQKFDVITAMHVLDWIYDTKRAVENLQSMLKPDGILVMAVFPPKHIIDSLKINSLFEKFDNEHKPKKGLANFDGIDVKVYVRDASYYDKMCSKLGMDKVLEYYPPYSKKFIMDYYWDQSLYPEMVVLVYRKTII